MTEARPDDRTIETLARDVSFLGRILGDVLREQGGETLFGAVEGLRLACRDHRHHPSPETQAEVWGRVDELPLDIALDVARAFTTYFHLINMAEENHRLRRITERESSRYPAPRDDSIRATVQTLRDAGVTGDEMRELLHKLEIRPVFTAHPTEARRMTLLRALRRLSELVEALESGVLSPSERDRLVGRLRAEVTALWQTNELRARQRTVLDEVRNGLYYFEESIFEVTIRIYRDMQEAVSEFYPELVEEGPLFLTFGSWIGGDRDGNPNVSAAITEETLRLHRSLAIREYVSAVGGLMDRLTASTALVGVSEELLESIERDSKRFAGVVRDQAERRSDEPYRQKLEFIRARLSATDMEREGSKTRRLAYARPDELIEDLEILRRSLCAHGGERIAGDALHDLLLQVRVFRFHVARLDIRQHRDRHLAALTEVFRCIGLVDSYSDLPETEKLRVLERALAHPALPAGRALSEETRETLEVFNVVARMQDELGREAVDTYIVSFTRDVSDLLGVLYLASTAGLFDVESGTSRLRVVPLFETEEDLESAPRIMDALWQHPVYRRQLAAWGSTQEIMLGYSDSDKDAGYMTANWLLYRAQQELTRAADAAAVTVTFFHGRGGAIGRGGGPLPRAILAQPLGTVRGRLKVTEQGEVLFTRYANPGIAHRHLEQVISAVILASGTHQPPTALAAWEALAAGLSGTASEAYRSLLSADGFLEFFQEGTPLRSIERLRIASRPARRRSGALELEDLRAIPWVFSWTQSRYGIPGWYGLGTAISVASGDGALKTLRQMYRDWPFFRWLVDAAQISLGKADLVVAGEYGHLVPDESVRERFRSQLRAEFVRTVQAVNDVIEQERLLDSWPMLQRSIELRNPYVDPMSYIQIRAIRDVRVEEDEGRAELLRSIIDRSVTGVAAGLQNTG